MILAPPSPLASQFDQPLLDLELDLVRSWGPPSAKQDDIHALLGKSDRV